MSIKQEFKDFIMRGNVIDLAVGMVVGTAFSGIVKSLVDDVIMPPIGIVLGGIDFSNLFLTLKHGKTAGMEYATLAAAKADGAVTMNVGSFINTIISFLIVATAIFVVVKAINTLKKLSKLLTKPDFISIKLSNVFQPSNSAITPVASMVVM